MNTLLFNQDHMSKYYNCSGRTYDEWKALGQPNILLGCIYIALGLIYIIILLPFMVVFIKSELMKYSCYKVSSTSIGFFFIKYTYCFRLCFSSG